MRREPFQGNTKNVRSHIRSHSTQKSKACEESTLEVRESSVSHGGLDSRRRSLRASCLLAIRVVLGPWRRELPCLQAAQRDRGAGERAESRTQRARVRQGPASTAARNLHGRRSVSCAMAACDAVESREAGHMERKQRSLTAPAACSREVLWRR